MGIATDINENEKLKTYKNEMHRPISGTSGRGELAQSISVE